MKKEIRILVDKEKCTGCCLCTDDCQRHVLEIQNKKAVVVNPRCLKCGHCMAVCPENAIKLDGFDDEILDMPAEPVFLDEKKLFTHLKFRRSVRQYKNTPVEKEKIEKIIEAGRLTPTASNMQNVRYIVVENEIGDIEDEVLAQYRQLIKPTSIQRHIIKMPFKPSPERLKRGFLFQKAPVAILVISPSEINACLAAMSMELMAESLGLGTVYVGLFTRPADRNKKLREKLGIAKEEKIAACLALGYSNVRYLRSVPKHKADVTWR